MGGVGDDPAAFARPNHSCSADRHDELVVAHDDPTDPEELRLAGIALTHLRAKWKLQPVDLVPVGHGIVERIAEKIRERGYLPHDEVNDTLILAEASLLN